MIQTGGIRWLAVLAFFTVLSTPVQAGRHDPMYVPEPIDVPAGASADNLRKDVHKALVDEGFSARDIAPGHAEGKRVKSGFHGPYFAVVDVYFDNKTIRISYKDSENLNYDPRNHTIYSTYNKWVRNIERRLRRNLGAY